MGGPVKESIGIQARSSPAGATSSHQIWFWAEPSNGRLRRPVSFAQKDPVFAACPATALLQAGELTAAEPGGEAVKCWRRCQ